MGNLLPYDKKSATYIPAGERINYSIRKKILFIPKEERKYYGNHGKNFAHFILFSPLFLADTTENF